MRLMRRERIKTSPWFLTADRVKVTVTELTELGSDARVKQSGVDEVRSCLQPRVWINGLVSRKIPDI